MECNRSWFVHPGMAALIWISTASAYAIPPLSVPIRTWEETQTGEWTQVEDQILLSPTETAIIVCDMWDNHWCEGAAARVKEMAPYMDSVLSRAREAGFLIIHAPSGTMDFYEGTPQRRRAKQAPHSEMPTEDKWRYRTEEEPPLPIDDSDGGCDTCDPECDDVNQRKWSRQIDLLTIGKEDYISDSGQEVYNILEDQHRKNVVVMGVHTNMCVLGRPFSIRANVQNGKNVYLMRDLTDAMYNPKMFPYVDHFQGTELVIEHIEKHWCPSMTSAALAGEEPFQFKR